MDAMMSMASCRRIFRFKFFLVFSVCLQVVLLPCYLIFRSRSKQMTVGHTMSTWRWRSTTYIITNDSLVFGTGTSGRPTSTSSVGSRPTSRPSKIDDLINCPDAIRHIDPSVAGRYLTEPEVTSLRLESTFDGGGGCAHYKQYGEGRVYEMAEDSRDYFKRNGGRFYLVEGTGDCGLLRCSCLAGWHGQSCSIPSSVWYSRQSAQVVRGLKPTHDRPSRRLIYAFPFNIEFSMFEARLAEFGDIVDVFLVLESNYTAYGQAKPYRLLEALCQGKYERYAHKIVHVPLDHFPAEAHKNGWIADGLHRNHLSQHGLRNLVRGYRRDDLFVLTDADEIPKRETMLFLKVHTGYPEVVCHTYETTIYGFFWKGSAPDTVLLSTVSVGILTQVLEWKAYTLRKGYAALLRNRANLNSYLKSVNSTLFKQWAFGNRTDPSGWHCSWCLGPEGIRNKLVSAQNGDFPRWGDYPEKLRLPYIAGLIAKGQWFDGKTTFSPRTCRSRNYAPLYFLTNQKFYLDLLKNGN